MQDEHAFPQLGMHVIDGILMVQTPDDFGDETFRAIRAQVLEKVHAKSVRGVLIDVSTIQIIDTVSFNLLVDTAKSVALLGAKTIFVGFQPGVVSSLIDLEVDLDSITAMVNGHDALNMLRPAIHEVEAEEEPDDEDEVQLEEEESLEPEEDTDLVLSEEDCAETEDECD